MNELLHIAVPIGLLVGGLFVAAFLWAARTGQFDDLDAPPFRAINDADPPQRGRDSTNTITTWSDNSGKAPHAKQHS